MIQNHSNFILHIAMLQWALGNKLLNIHLSSVYIYNV